jgi:hypothetical protein
MKYKDIINFSAIKKLKKYLNDVCILYNRIIRPENLKNRESDLYEVYTNQYKTDMEYFQQLRDNCLKTADLCNKILLDMNTYHIKQYYIDPQELQNHELSDEYQQENAVVDEDDMW